MCLPYGLGSDKGILNFVKVVLKPCQRRGWSLIYIVKMIVDHALPFVKPGILSS